MLSALTVRWAGTIVRAGHVAATRARAVVQRHRTPKRRKPQKQRKRHARNRRHRSPRKGSRYLPSMDTPLPVSPSPTADNTVAASAPVTAPQAPTSTVSGADATTTTTPEAPATPGVVSEDQVKLALRRVKDPDLQLNVVDLGLIYGTRVDGTTVSVDMTLTSPGCPSGPEIMADIEREVKTLPGVEQANVNLIWTPFWTPDRIEPRVRAYLGL